MKVFLFPVFAILLSTACQQDSAPAYKPDPEGVAATLDAWHQAASDADFDAYFSHFSDENAIFMGTDATERWDVAEFKEYARPHFEAGRAWNFTAHDRHIYFNESATVAWFDEELDTPNLGPSRGTGVLTRVGDGWKIAHYNLTVPIPNEIVYDVVQEIDSLGGR